MAETKKTTKKAETKPVETEKTFTSAEVEAMIQKALADYASKTPVVQTAKEEYVTLCFIGAIAAGTVVSLGKLGQINSAGMPRDFVKKDFIDSLGIPVVDALLRSRELVVLDGLTDIERERFGVDYKEGETLTTQAFYSLLSYDKKKICEIYARLCDAHKKTVAKIYQTAYFENHDNRITPDTVKALNKLSKKVDQKGLFTSILEYMGNKLKEDEENETTD